MVWSRLGKSGSTKSWCISASLMKYSPFGSTICLSQQLGMQKRASQLVQFVSFNSFIFVVIFWLGPPVIRFLQLRYCSKVWFDSFFFKTWLYVKLLWFLGVRGVRMWMPTSVSILSCFCEFGYQVKACHTIFPMILNWRKSDFIWSNFDWCQTFQDLAKKEKKKKRKKG